ncbi:MAG: calcium/sodium antiporter [Candidatus Omnitrophota bacterium]
MGIYKDFIILIVGIAVIIKSADLFTNAAQAIAAFFKIPRSIVGLTIVSIATTMPEFAVSAFSSYMKVGGIAVGNATGSCLANIGLILGIAAIISTVKLKAQTVNQDLRFLCGVSFFLLVLMWDGMLSFLDGAILVTMMIGFFVFVVMRQLKLSKQDNNQRGSLHNIKKDVVKFLIGSAGVVIAAKYAIIPSGVAVAQFFSVPEVVIGVSMIAVGTSLPELVTAVVASRKKMGDLAAGNVIGANILNILWVLGCSSMINPLEIDARTKMLTMPLLILFAVMVYVFAGKKFEITRNAGIIFVSAYAGYIIYIVKFAYK